LEPDQAVRRLELGTELHPSLAWVAGGLLNEQLETEARDGSRWLHYPSPPEHYRSAKLEQVISEDGMPAGFFKGKLVVVGVGLSAGTTGSVRDQFATPWTRVGGAWVPGAAIHGTAMLNLARGDWLNRWDAGWESAFVILFGCVAGFGFMPGRPLRVALAMLGCVLGFAVLGILLPPVAGQWCGWMIPAVVQCPLIFLSALGWNALKDYRDKGILEESLSRHFSPARVRQVLAYPHRLQPGAEKREVSLLMTDIQGFSKITALMSAGDLVGLLNDYYERVIACVHATEGTVMDLVGDSMFALWNAPESQENYVDRAAHSALRLREVLRAFDAEHAELPLRTRMGLHAGTVWVGNIGSPRRFDFAAVGEPVNLAARLQALNKPLGTRLLATRDFLQMATVPLGARLLGHFALRGIDQPTAVFEVMENPEAASRAWLKVFARALHDFQRKEFSAARTAFEEVLEGNPEDGPSRFYRGKLDELGTQELPRDWMGVVSVE